MVDFCLYAAVEYERFIYGNELPYMFDSDS